MATRNPRVNVTLKPEQYELISNLAALRGIPRTQVFVELLEASQEVLERVVSVLAAAQRTKLVYMGEIKQGMKQAEAEVQPLVDKAFSVLAGLDEDMKKWKQ